MQGAQEALRPVRPWPDQYFHRKWVWYSIQTSYPYQIVPLLPIVEYCPGLADKRGVASGKLPPPPPPPPPPLRVAPASLGERSGPPAPPAQTQSRIHLEMQSRPVMKHSPRAMTTQRPFPLLHITHTQPKDGWVGKLCSHKSSHQ